MTPDQLRSYIKVLREEGCMSAALKLGDGIEIAVALGPDRIVEEGFGQEPTPGGWKSDTGKLDMPFTEDSTDRIPQ